MKAFRATLEDTLKAQDDLIQYFEILIAENRPLRPDERKRFLQLVARALLGQGTSIRIEDTQEGTRYFRFRGSNLPGGTVAKNCDDLLRFMAFVEKKELDLIDGSKRTIGNMWQRCREFTLRALPHALSKAASMSAERVPYEPTLAERF